MKSIVILTPMLMVLAAGAYAAVQLEEVASFPNQQVTGVAVSKTGRVFVNFPNWSDDHTISVAEVTSGLARPFPNPEMNSAGEAGKTFVCVQSVYVDADDNLWILDPAAPKMKEVVPGGPKLVKVDLTTNRVAQTISFGEDVAPRKSYLNDVRVDTRSGTAFVTDSGLGAIIVTDLRTGKSRRLLENDKSTKAEKEVGLNVDGRELLDQEKKSTPQIHSDGIALDIASGYLYYHALTGHTLYRIKTDHLKDPTISSSDLAKKVENMGSTPAPDGMLESSDGRIYLTAIERNSIVRFDPSTRKTETIIEDKRLSWPDSMSWGLQETLFVTCSQIHNSPRFNEGRDARTEPYRVYKVSGMIDR